MRARSLNHRALGSKGRKGRKRYRGLSVPGVRFVSSEICPFRVRASAPQRHVLFFTAIGSAFGNRQHRLPAVSCHVPSRYDTSSKGGGLSYCGTSPERFLRDSRSYLRRFEIENSEANCATCVSFIQARPRWEGIHRLGHFSTLRANIGVQRDSSSSERIRESVSWTLQCPLVTIC